MAIFHLKHSSVGRSTHSEGTAGAHVSYITRSGACREVLGSGMPIPAAGERGGEARAWLDAQEMLDRKNARVIDKVTIALPLELDAMQRVELVREFAEEVTGGRVPWLAALHDKEQDADNPHCHLILRDRDLETGKMALRMSQKGSTEMLRETWERIYNAALERAGHEARVDRRTLEAQGIDRAPQKHIGPIAKAIDADGRHSWKLEAVRQEEAEENKKREEATPPQSHVENPRGTQIGTEAIPEPQSVSAAPQRPTEAVEAPLTSWEAFRRAKKEVWRAYKELWQAHLDHLNGAPARPFSLVTAYRELWQVAVDLWPFEGRADNPADVTAAREKPTAGLATDWACVYHPDIADDTAQKSAAWTAAEPERKRIEEEQRAADFAKVVREARCEAEREIKLRREAEAKQQSSSSYKPF